MKPEVPRLSDRIIRTISRYSMLAGRETVLLGLSGGPDSICLLHLLDEIKDKYELTIHAVYIDHRLRPDEIPAEINLCREICAESGINLIVKSIDVKSYEKEKGLNRQEAARELRYMMFDETAFEIRADKIAVAHNADDQAETFFMRLLRGAGPKGLTGIPPVTKHIIRPLIETERSEIEEYLGSRNILYAIDSSNLKTDYIRNRIRLSLMPELKKMNPNLTSSILNTMSILREEERYLEIIVTKTLMKLISRKAQNRIELFLSPMEAMETVILRRVLRRAIAETRGLRGIGFQHIEEIIGLIKEGISGDRIYLPKDIRVIKAYSVLVITSEKPVRIAEYELQPPGEVAVKGAGTVIKASLKDMSEDFGDGKTSVLLDADLIHFPLKIRPRMEGDHFFPLGFGMRKKLQDYFVDEKVPRDERDSVPVVLSDSDIVWIAGYRADERFRVTEKTKKFLRLVIVKGRF
jgi:tRNA(Ile)-lysidine synthase